MHLFSTIACLQEAKPGSTSANENRAASTTRVSGVAPQTSTPSRPARRSRFPPSKEGAASLPTLEHFLMQNRFAALYRSFIRATRNIPNPDARREMIDWIRGDLEPARRVTDLVNLKDRLMLGHVQLKRLQGPVELVSASDVGGPAFGSFTPFRRSGDTSRSANSLDTSAS
ncbi:hypothetical protein IE81DRAFT_63561 [Ceraceosorus guamensis]|uniref:Complex 1 LYR protein domain-containing protein n=1 Tax=Ceraceosorus guamensis TaxID=1522189 RepID=A0A316VPE3_9BASI|nr:hypothetical protein IE81DRAFT_63561 [Ceraceosorus guamensis]PWN38938.1 hypothetical protein IE81DRAFT_63561 [Ceraceosorus guamensis]